MRVRLCVCSLQYSRANVGQVRLPVVIVFTKYDLLFIAKYQEARKSGTSKEKLLTTAEKNAAADLRKRLDGFRDDNINLKFVEWVKDSRSNYQSVRWVKVSTDANGNSSYYNSYSHTDDSQSLDQC